MKIKQIHEFVKGITDICAKKVKDAEDRKLPQENISYEEGRLYESMYILSQIEKIIYDEQNY
jgi:hypothetical protein